MAAVKKQAENVQRTERKFSREQILLAEKYRKRRDLVGALLDDKEKYTFEAVDNLIEKYMKGEVK